METEGRTGEYLYKQTDRQTDGPTDMTKIIGAFRDCTIAPKIVLDKKIKFSHMSFCDLGYSADYHNGVYQHSSI
jgi:hypothetical protein